MTPRNRNDVRIVPALLGLTAAVFLSIAPVSAAEAVGAEPVGEMPTLAVSRSEPVDEALRKRVPETVEDLRAIEQRVHSLIESLQAVTVGVRRGPAQGSGVIISEDGYVLTAAHVSGPPGRPVTLIMNDGTHYDAVSLGCHIELDAGLVKITEKGNWPVARLASPRDLKVGDWVIGTGHPGGFDAARPPVIRLGRVITRMKSVVHTDVVLVGGDSGGPLFDLNGRIVGIHSRIGPGAELNFHVPVNAFTDNWYWMLAGEERPVETGPGGPMLGVDGENVANGCAVTAVTSDSPARQAGLEVGDVIQKIDDRFILSLEDLVSSINQYGAGESIAVTFRRDGELRTVRLELAERPARPARRSRDER